MLGHDAAGHERVHRDLERQAERLHGDERPNRQLREPRRLVRRRPRVGRRGARGEEAPGQYRSGLLQEVPDIADASELFREMVVSDDFTEFLTLPAYERLD